MLTLKMETVIEHVRGSIDNIEGDEMAIKLGDSLFALTKELKSAFIMDVEDGKNSNSSFLVGRLLVALRIGLIKLHSQLRSSILRAMRYMLVSGLHVKTFLEYRLDVFIVMGLEREQQDLWERMQALKLVRRIVEVAPDLMPRSIARSLVAVMRSTEDNFRRVCIETVRILALANPLIVSSVNGFRWMLIAISDTVSRELVDPVTCTLCALFEKPSMRKYLRPDYEVSTLLRDFFEPNMPGGTVNELPSYDFSRRALVILSRSWAGLLLLISCDNGLRAITSQLGASSSSIDMDAQDGILDAFRALLSLVSGVTCKREADRARVLQMFGRNRPVVNMLHSRAALFCAAMVHIGIIQCLLNIAVSASWHELQKKSCDLLVDVLLLCRTVLSHMHCSKIMDLPKSMQDASNLSYFTKAGVEAGDRVTYSLMIQQRKQDALVRNVTHCFDSAIGGGFPLPQFSKSTGGGLSNNKLPTKPTTVLKQGGRSVAWLMEQDVLKTREHKGAWNSSTELSFLVGQSRVLNTKDWSRWDWNAIHHIVKGPLQEESNLIKMLQSAWVKRVLGCFRFTAHADARQGVLHTKRWELDTFHYIHIACFLLRALLSCTSGTTFLQNGNHGGILQDIVKELTAAPVVRENKGRHTVEDSKLFDSESCQRRLSCGYGLLLMNINLSSDAGRSLATKFSIWDVITRMPCDRGSVVRMLLASIDCTRPPDSLSTEREGLLLQKLVQKGSPTVKIYAITVMSCFIRISLKRANGTASDLTPLDFQLMNSLLNVMEEYENDDDLGGSGGASLGIGVVDYSLRAAAVSVLVTGCDLSKCWTVALVSEWSKRKKKCSLVPELAWKFLLVEEGVKLLQDREWLKGELQKWETSYSKNYVQQITSMLQSVYGEVGDVAEEEIAAAAAIEDQTMGGTLSRSTGPHSIPITLGPTHESLFGGWDGQGLQLLQRLPWSMDVILSRDGLPRGVSLRMDVFVISPLGLRGGEGGGHLGGIPKKLSCIRGIVVDSKGNSMYKPVEPHMVLHARLCVGSCVVSHRGTVLQPSNGCGAGGAGAGATACDDINTDESSGMWSTCHPHEWKSFLLQKQPTRLQNELPPYSHAQHLSQAFERVSVPGNAAQYIFAGPGRGGMVGAKGLSSSRHESKQSFFLCAVEFTLSLETEGPSSIPLLPHLYGHLASTDEGCSVLVENVNLDRMLGCFDLAVAVSNCDDDDHFECSSLHQQQEDDSTTQKADILCLGHIASCLPGLKLLLERKPDFCSLLTKACLSAGDISVRSACMDAISLVVSNTQGRHAMKQVGWEMAHTPGVYACLPKELNSLFSPIKWKFLGDPAAALTVVENMELVAGKDPMTMDTMIHEPAEDELIQILMRLSCPLMSRGARKQLRYLLKDKTKVEMLKNTHTFLQIHEFLANYDLPLSVRRVAFDIMEIPWDLAEEGWPNPSSSSAEV